MLTCLQKHEYDNYGCEKEVADFYACVNEFQVIELMKCFSYSSISNRRQMRLKKQI